MKREFVCIVCPRGCPLSIDLDTLEVTGNTCKRGELYAKAEVTNPTRIITSSVRVNNRDDRLVSVKTTNPVPKGKMFEVMKEINKTSVSAPVHIGDVVIHNILGLEGVDIVITKDID